MASARLTWLVPLLFFTLTSLSPAAEEPYPVEGAWYACAGLDCISLNVGEGQVKFMGKDLCTDPVVKREGGSLVIVDCLAGEEAAQLYFFFQSAWRASLFISGKSLPLGRAGNLWDARRKTPTPLPEGLLGSWSFAYWPSQRERQPESTLEVRQNFLKSTFAGHTTVCQAIHLESADAATTDIYLDCGGSRSGGVMRFRPVSQGVWLLHDGLQRGVTTFLHPEGGRPPWLPVEAGGSVPGICDGIGDPAKREKCYMSRGLCEKIADADASARCREEVDLRRTKSAVAEVRSNLDAIRSTEVAYYAEYNKFVGNQPPTPVADRRGNNAPADWARNTRFALLGFAPEGKVRCSYALEGSDFLTAEEGLTARAECDLDRDGQLSVWKITNGSIEIRHSGDDY